MSTNVADAATQFAAVWSLQETADEAAPALHCVEIDVLVDAVDARGRDELDVAGGAHALEERQVQQFRDDGFLIVEDVFTRSELQPAMDELAEMVDRFVERLYAAGRLSNRHRDKDLHSRLIAIDKEFPGAAMLFMLKTELGPALARLWSSPKLLDMIDDIDAAWKATGGEEKTRVAGRPA